MNEEPLIGTGSQPHHISTVAYFDDNLIDTKEGPLRFHSYPNPIKPPNFALFWWSLLWFVTGGLFVWITILGFG